MAGSRDRRTLLKPQIQPLRAATVACKPAGAAPPATGVACHANGNLQKEEHAADSMETINSLKSATGLPTSVLLKLATGLPTSVLLKSATGLPTSVHLKSATAADFRNFTAQ